MKGKLMKSAALFYVGVAVITASLASGFITYYYPVYTEIGREDIPVHYFADIYPVPGTPIPPPNRTFLSTLVKYETAYPLRDYALLTYLFSGTGLALIVVDRFKRNKSEVE